MPSLLAVKTDERDALIDERKTLMGQAETASSFEGLRERIEEIDATLPALDKDIALFTGQRERDRRAAATASTQESPLAEGPVTPLGAFRRLASSLSSQFLGSDEWQSYLRERAPAGKFSDKARIESPKIPIVGSVLGSLLGRRGRSGAIVTGGGATSAGAFIVADDTGIYDDGGLQRELSLLDLITRGTTDSDTVEFVRATSFTNNAATVAEADSVTVGDTTGLKPQSTMAFERVQPGVKIIAHWEAATRNALGDTGQIRTIIEGFLRYGILEELEDQVASGGGTGEDFEGLTVVSGTGSQVFDTDIPTTLRRAITKVRTGGRARANGIALHPVAAEALDIELLNSAAAYYRAATIDEAARIWSLPIVQTEALDENVAIVADFRRAVLWDRQQTTIEASSGYENFFLKNLVAILAEMRAAFGVIRPSAFVIVDIEY